jgi:opacity protein-like surface antigen
MRFTARLAAALLGSVLLLPVVPARAADVSLDLEGGYFGLNARDSAKAVFGSGGGLTFGGGLRFYLGKHVFLGAGARIFKKTGERVFVAGPGQPVFPLGHPLEVRILPIEATLGYRFASGTKLVPYVGVGGGFASYREKSTVGGLEESESLTKASGHVLAGIEYGSGSARIGVEVRYSRVPNAVGLGGVSAVYGESDIGGLAILGRLSFRAPR